MAALPLSHVFAVTYMSNDKVPKTIPEALNRLSEFPTQYIAIHALLPKTFVYKCILLTPDDELRNSYEKIQSAIKGSQGLSFEKLLVIVNPASGAKKGPAIYENVISGMFKLANIDAKMIVTERAGHAVELMKGFQKGDADAIVAVGGDGILHEIINGLLKRDDWQSVCRTPIAPIAAGSASAINKNLDTLQPLSAALSIVKGHARDVDIFSVAQDHDIFFSHLNLVWGLIADIDIESEKMRWAGSIRFTVYGIMRIVKMRYYVGEFYYLSAEKAGQLPQCEQCTKFPGPPLKFYNSNVEEWTLVNDGPFSFFQVTNLPWISPDFLASPDARMANGVMELMWITQNSVSSAMGVLLDSASAKHLDVANSNYVKDVVALYLIPGHQVSSATEPKDGILDLSGEKIPYGPIRLEVHPRTMQLIVPPWYNEEEVASPVNKRRPSSAGPSARNSTATSPLPSSNSSTFAGRLKSVFGRRSSELNRNLNVSVSNESFKSIPGGMNTIEEASPVAIVPLKNEEQENVEKNQNLEQEDTQNLVQKDSNPVDIVPLKTDTQNLEENPVELSKQNLMSNDNFFDTKEQI